LGATTTVSQHVSGEKPASPLWRRTSLWLGAILILSAAARLYKLDGSPPGLQTDEVVVAYNARCLLATGRDWAGDRWPIFYMRGLGGNPSPMYTYATIPFQAIGGMGVWTTRLPSALASIVTVLLVYYVGLRMFGRLTGLIAAALLAVSSWHILVSRMAMSGGASLVPLLIAGSLAMFLAANLPFSDDKRPARPILAGLAGAVAAFSCYGYLAVRLFLPVFLLLSVLLTWREWRALLKTRRTAAAAVAMVLAGGAVIAPLAYAHLTDPEMYTRAAALVPWKETDPLATKLAAVLSRYGSHFGASFLFSRGDRYFMHSMTGGGVCYWYMLPLMVVGLAAAVRRFRRSPAARILLVWLVLYPIADVVSDHPGPHLLRGSPGIVVFPLLSALGAVAAGTWIWRRRRSLAIACACVLGVLYVASAGRYAYKLFVTYPKDTAIYHRCFVDFAQAAKWIRPYVDDVDAVFCSTDRSNLVFQAFAYMLVGLDYDPHQWLRDRHVSFNTATRKVHRSLGKPCFGYHEQQLSFGKFHFMFGDLFTPALGRLWRNGREDMVIFIVRPGEMVFDVPPLHKIRRPDGGVVLLIYKVRC